MKVSGAPVERGHRFAIFWGGGLGDILALRPLLMALEATLDTPPFFFTTATHMQGLFSQLGLRTQPHILPPKPAAALRTIWNLGVRFDWLYIGPYPRIKTRMLAHAVRARRIWSKHHATVSPFIGEQVLADVRDLGLQGPEAIHLPYGGKWPGAEPERNGKVETARPYLVLHPGAKGRWETTRWPEACWTGLMQQILLETDLELMLVGVPSEQSQLEALRERLESDASKRIRVEADISLPGLAATLESSSGVICHNSGILHLATMLGRATVAVTGSSAIFWRPPYAHVVNVTSGACNIACNQYRCPVPFFHAKCIRHLQVADVMIAVRRMLLPREGVSS